MLRPCGSYDKHLLAKALDHGGDLAVAFVWSCYAMLRDATRRVQAESCSATLIMAPFHALSVLFCKRGLQRYNMLQHVTACYSMLQHVTTYFSTFQYIQPSGPTCD